MAMSIYTFVSRGMSFNFSFESKNKICVKPFLTTLLAQSYSLCLHLHYRFNIKKKKKRVKTALINNWC